MRPIKNDKNSDTSIPTDPSRRALLKNAGLLGAVAGFTAVPPVAAQTTQTTIPLREALENLTALEAGMLDVIADRILPADENGPGAREARAVHYIDRALAAHHRRHRTAYTDGLQALHEHAMATQGKPLTALTAAEQDKLLIALESSQVSGAPTSFFSILRSHVLEGTFSDPYYGGNHNFIGWDLLRYPGVRLGSTAADVAQGAALPPSRQSAYDHALFTKSANNQNQGAR
ncbi:MAG: gluconate 2-dehydrogenase subunit 3 family protein [Pseudomonadales bacterium]|nr:gluconate 2-dehydrogenase subunit 3 family protein [Pseudomonadales bacterium]